MTVLCPNCGFKHSGEPFAQELDHLIFQLPLKEKDLLVRLINARGAKVSQESMFAYLWGDNIDGGPESGLHGLHTHVSKLKKKLERLGWTIKTKRFDGMRLARMTP